MFLIFLIFLDLKLKIKPKLLIYLKLINYIIINIYTILYQHNEVFYRIIYKNIPIII